MMSEEPPEVRLYPPRNLANMSVGDFKSSAPGMVYP